MSQKPCLTLLAVLASAYPSAVRADITDQNETLSANSTLNLDTGAKGTSGGDILWSGSSLTPQGSATVYDAGNLGAAGFGFLTQDLLAAFGPLYSAAPIPSSKLPVGEVIAVHTNSGHYAAILVTALSGSSISVEYTTFGALGGQTGPSITSVVNNYGNIPQGLPNYGIAPGSLFAIKGSALNSQPPSALQSSAKPGLQTTVNGTSISVTVNGTTTHPLIYYTSATQLDGVLPSNTPVGMGTITVTNGSQTSSPAQIQVVASAFGIDTLSGSGSGTGVAQDLNGNVITVTSSASPGQILTFWGSGVGADPGNDDKLFPQNLNNLTNIPLTVYIGGLSADIAYRGRSQYPGVDVVVITVPKNVQPGCNVAVETVSGAVVSNFVTLPIAVGNGTCVDPPSFTGLTPEQLATATANGGLRVGSFAVARIAGEGGVNAPPSSDDILSGSFDKTPLKALQSGIATPSIGSCVVWQFPLPTPTTTIVGLDAGVVTVTTPDKPYTLYQVPTQKGTYELVFLPGTTSAPGLINDGTRLTPGSYTFSASGGVDVGPATASITFPMSFAWTNIDSISSIDRTQPLTINWSGGVGGGVVTMNGQSSLSNGVGAAFECLADPTQGTFTIPAYVLLALPPSFSEGGHPVGSLSVGEFLQGSTFSARGLDYGVVLWEHIQDKGVIAYK